MRIVTVYDHPLDYPDWFVARESRVVGWRVMPGGIVAKAKDLDTLRELIAELFPRLHRFPRLPDDEPVIVEVWL